ncbi:flagellar basal body rod protein FlgB [Polycladidibacter stylochi]|uniref:flagellar basal body rod protein FlgB n=1 Tax=Polycladidibacter stylochi TaxID=1807766 RepID=UPI0009E74F83|nr:flagellar basal body rod protein FlgB [Pseudovibrio stylochi]
MSLANLPILQALRNKLDWHQQRQGILAQNIANADTPGYESKDIAPISFDEVLANNRHDVALKRTNSAHLGADKVQMTASSRSYTSTGYEVTPDGNSVVLEEQMTKLAENQMEYQLATSLYSKSLGILKSALRK